MRTGNSVNLLRLALVASVALVATHANATLIPYAIPGVTGKGFQHGDSFDPGNGSFSRIFDGSGLTVGNPLIPSTWTHDNQWPSNWQGSGAFTNGNTPGAWLVADLGFACTNLQSLYVWNVREVLDRGTRAIDLYYAISPTVAPVTDSAYSFASGGWTGLGSYIIPQATGSGTPADAVLNLAGVPSARYIGFAINSNYGSTFRVGFAELEFTPTPEPATLTLLGLGSLALLRRRRKSH